MCLKCSLLAGPAGEAAEAAEEEEAGDGRSSSGGRRSSRIYNPLDSDMAEVEGECAGLAAPRAAGEPNILAPELCL